MQATLARPAGALVFWVLCSSAGSARPDRQGLGHKLPWPPVSQWGLCIPLRTPVGLQAPVGRDPGWLLPPPLDPASSPGKSRQNPGLREMRAQPFPLLPVPVLVEDRQTYPRSPFIPCEDKAPIHPAPVPHWRGWRGPLAPTAAPLGPCSNPGLLPRATRQQACVTAPPSAIHLRPPAGGLQPQCRPGLPGLTPSHSGL